MKTFFTTLAGCATTLSVLSSLTVVSAQQPDQCGKGNEPEDSYWSVVGVRDCVEPRLELRQLEKDQYGWNLFLLAMEKFQAMDQNLKRSYFQIAGIHGAPFTAWDRVNGTGEMGYCPHGSNMFGTWHRPYLAAFEQVLHDRAVEIANQWTGDEKAKYTDAANKLRLPYWDWAMTPDAQDGAMPMSLRRVTASVTYPNGTKADIANPLYSYKFHPLNKADFKPLADAGLHFDDWDQTVRLPKDQNAEVTTSDNDQVEDRIAKQQVNNRDMVYKLLTVWQPFNEWSNKANGGKIGNLETLHDGIHNSFGIGHMGIIEVSAFDPVFWFHHCNVDRILAIYQQRFPDTYVEPSAQSKATFTVPLGSTQDVTSDLKPFHMNPQGKFWTSNSSRNWWHFGYTYPELQDNPNNNTLTLKINKLYKADTQGLNKNNTLSTRDYHDTTTPNPADSVTNRTADAIDWMAEVNLPSDIQVTYGVRAFLGKPHTDPKSWPTDPNYVGQVASLASPRQDSSVIVTANVMLTDMLATKYKAGHLKSFNKQDVIEYLKEHFYWRIQQNDLKEIARWTPPAGLNVTVVSVPVKLPRNETEVPHWIGDFEYHTEIGGNPKPLNGSSAPSSTSFQTVFATGRPYGFPSMVPSGTMGVGETGVGTAVGTAVGTGAGVGGAYSTGLVRPSTYQRVPL
ncbi:common central domain of tyrosinase-domain-containing protein [Lophiotrema nucula]|uniref:tyrosinase n=1 Tax=Lophiotrema nucula TaxID=690887 RepID=A0A6A5ZAH0_9PLEO|nr:common central domain of tyrosinase-domain-containing protein [Lophiotrema nucula]